MEFGLMVEPQVGGSYARLRELVLWAEEQGLKTRHECNRV